MQRLYTPLWTCQNPVQQLGFLTRDWEWIRHLGAIQSKPTSREMVWAVCLFVFFSQKQKPLPHLKICKSAELSSRPINLLYVENWTLTWSLAVQTTVTLWPWGCSPATLGRARASTGCGSHCSLRIPSLRASHRVLLDLAAGTGIQTEIPKNMPLHSSKKNSFRVRNSCN